MTAQSEVPVDPPVGFAEVPTDQPPVMFMPPPADGQQTPVGIPFPVAPTDVPVEFVDMNPVAEEGLDDEHAPDFEVDAAGQRDGHEDAANDHEAVEERAADPVEQPVPSAEAPAQVQGGVGIRAMFAYLDAAHPRATEGAGFYLSLPTDVPGAITEPAKITVDAARQIARTVDATVGINDEVGLEARVDQQVEAAKAEAQARLAAKQAELAEYDAALAAVEALRAEVAEAAAEVAALDQDHDD